MQLYLDPEDFSEVRSAVAGLLTFDPSDEQIYGAIGGDRDLLGSAFMWGWGDEQVRARLCWRLEYFGRGNYA